MSIFRYKQSVVKYVLCYVIFCLFVVESIIPDSNLTLTLLLLCIYARVVMGYSEERFISLSTCNTMTAESHSTYETLATVHVKHNMNIVLFDCVAVPHS